MEKRYFVMGLAFLFIFSTIVPISMGYNVKISDKIIQSSVRGNTLYVGGSGQDNYTRIQDAIDNASDSDTVFVYNGTYTELPWLDIKKSINLLGEDKNYTIIDNQYYYDVIHLCKDNIKISGFTIKNSHYLNDIFGIGILFNSSNIIISDNIINNNYFGIESLYYASNITIQNNEIYGNNIGIDTYLSSNCNISRNILRNNNIGLGLQHGDDHSIVLNNFENNNISVVAFDSYNSLFTLNSFENNKISVEAIYSYNYLFTKNNFINNKKNLRSLDSISTWNSNYWGRPMIFPKSLIAWKTVEIIKPKPPNPGIGLPLPYLMFDNKPALTPYDI